MSTTDLVALLTTVNVALHNTVMGLVPQAIAEPEMLRQHYLEGHLALMISAYGVNKQS